MGGGFRTVVKVLEYGPIQSAPHDFVCFNLVYAYRLRL
jgi:hypothetical protein